MDCITLHVINDEVHIKVELRPDKVIAIEHRLKLIGKLEAVIEDHNKAALGYER
jgi:hypothetical protein